MFVLDVSKEPEVLNRTKQDISLMSYNLLLPNAGEGWWVFKYYHPDIPTEVTQWEARKKQLQEQISTQIDLMTFQECVLETHEQDLDFLSNTHTMLCHRRARIAMVTAWKSERFELLAEYHLNRTLLTVLREQSGLVLGIVNCHLSAGRHPQDRFHQVVKAMQQLEKLRNRFDFDLLIWAGDFNSSAEGTAVQRFFEDGIVEPRFRESFYPEIEITSKVREQRVGKFEEVYRHLTDPSTMWVRNSAAVMVHSKTRRPLPAFLEAVNALFEQFAQGKEWLDSSEMEAWIQSINQGLRGTEYRAALEKMSNREGGMLHRADFVEIYLQEVHAGKHWAVYHDLLRHNITLPRPEPFIARYALDQIWLRSRTYMCSGVVTPISRSARERLEAGEFVPNAWHPSDHFPMIVRFSPRLW